MYSPPKSMADLPSRSPRRRPTVILILFAAILSVLGYRCLPQPVYLEGPLRSIVPATRESILARDRKLVLVLPAHESSPDLCKVVASAVALGYPAPVIINWQQDSTTAGQSHLRKVSGMVEFLQWATSDDADEADRIGELDLVLMMDAHDVWLQLPPSVLLERYLESNEQANARLRGDHGLADNDMIEQTILVASQKGCVAPRNRMSSLNCHAAPESTLPDNLYGVFTDSVFRKVEYSRPRYLNSGNFLGPAGDMRRYFERVEERMNHHLAAISSMKDLDGDQGIFAEIFGEQEVWRQRVAAKGMVHKEITEEVALLAWSHYEYHIGLDYEQQLFYPTCHSEEGGAFVKLNDDEFVAAESLRAGVDPVRIDGLSGDLTQAEKPLAELERMGLNEPGWGEVPLFADFWTTAVPVSIHHNALKKGLKRRLRTWWDRTWFFPYLRELIASRTTKGGGLRALVSVVGEAGYWYSWAYKCSRPSEPSLIFERNSKSGNWALRSADWGHICPSRNVTAENERPWHEELFRDGMGPI